MPEPVVPSTPCVRLPFSVKEVFARWLEDHYPDRKEKILGRIRESQGDSLSHGEFGKRMTGVGVWAEQIAQHWGSLVRSGIAGRERPRLSTTAFRLPPDNDLQLNLAF